MAARYKIRLCHRRFVTSQVLRDLDLAPHHLLEKLQGCRLNYTYEHNPTN